MIAWYASTLFLSALLLFLMQPMVGKLLLPRFGGSPAVWTTSMLAFQGLLLAGYLYAHLTIRWLGARRQAWLHVALLLLPLACLPIELNDDGTADAQGSASSLLRIVLLRCGPPLLAVSATAPLLLRWFAATSHPAARDPYFLYAASNAGSLLGLIAFPLLLEPRLGILRQLEVWRYGYLLLIAGIALAAWLLHRHARVSNPSIGGAADPPLAPRIADADAMRMPRHAGVRQVLHWIALALVPSSAMLGVTSHITTDVAATPLLWAAPLGIYLATFIWAFARRTTVPLAWIDRLFPGIVLVMIPLLFLRVALPVGALLGAHYGVLALIALLCHGALARSRPAPDQLTAFFGWISLGGALGGVCNALVAPLLFDSTLEYPLMLAAAALLRPAPHRLRRPDRIDWLMLGSMIVALYLAARIVHWQGHADQLASVIPVYGIPAAICFMLRRRTLPFAAGVLVLVVGFGWFTDRAAGTLLLAERNFFGVIRVVDEGDHRVLVHGTTIHGVQRARPQPSQQPLAYFHRAGPIGDVFEVLAARGNALRIAIAGLGVGTIAAYGQPSWSMRFLELDPAMARVARDPDLFTYLARSRAQVEVTLGDARLLLAADPTTYDLLILDAFGSDSVPFHLLSTEAIALYLTRLEPHGWLVFNVTNRYLDLAPTLHRNARELGLACLARQGAVTAEQAAEFLFGAHFVAMARQPIDLAGLAARDGWRVPPLTTGHPLSDDHSSVLRLLR